MNFLTKVGKWEEEERKFIRQKGWLSERASAHQRWLPQTQTLHAETTKSMSSIDYLLKKIRRTGTVNRQPCSGRPRSARTDENIETVDDLVLSQEDKPKTHRSTCQISRETGIHCSRIHRIILQLKCLKRRRAQQLSEAHRVARLTRCKQLLKRYDDSAFDFIWFTDEKVFIVEPPFTSQNDRVYAPVRTKKRFIQPSRLLRTRSTFSMSVMVAVSKMGVTELMFVEPKVKVNGQYYRNVLLSQQMIPAIKQVAGLPARQRSGTSRP